MLQSNPDDLSVLMAYAEANLRKGSRLEAMKTYQKLVRLKPDVPDIRYALAKIYFSMNHYSDSLGELARIFEIAPKHIESHLLLRRIEKKGAIPEEMKETLAPHLDFTASPSRIKTIQMQFDLEKRKYERLINDYNKQLEEDEDNPIILYNRTKAEERVKVAEENLAELNNLIGEEEEEEKPAFVPLAETVEPETSDVPEEAVQEEESSDSIGDELESIMDEEESDALASLSMTGDSPVGVPLEEMEDSIVEVESEKTEEDLGEPVLSSERLEFYENIKGDLEKVLKSVNKARGVSSSLVLDHAGHIISDLISEDFDPGQLGMMILQGVKPLISWKVDEGKKSRELLYWVLEFRKGLLVLQPLSPEIYLVVLGSQGANFGAVKYSIEKNTNKLQKLLTDIPA